MMDRVPTMDNSFTARVRKIFGSLSSSSAQSSVWSLTDDEVEKREWNRPRDNHKDDDETPLSSSFDGFFTRSAKINTNHFKGGTGDHVDGDRDEWEIRSSIGLDCTLDNEEEEDEYDKVAEGRENAGDRLYMRDITAHGPYLNSHNVLPNLEHDIHRKPCANNLDAKIRLKEDEAAAEKFESDFEKAVRNVQEPCIEAPEDGFNLKSILKRKNNEALKPSKRVRFDLNFKEDCEEASKSHQDFLAGTPLVETKSSTVDSLLDKDKPRLPDYLLNPSKYTRYSLDSSSEIGEESNSRACMDFLELIKKSQSVMLEMKSVDASMDLKKSVTFIPRKKGSDAAPVSCSSEVKPSCEDGSEQNLKQASFPVGIAAGVDQQIEVGVMQEDEPEMDIADGNGGFQKPGRHYRTRSRLEDSVS